MPIFQTSKPQYTSWQRFQAIASRVIFPPILLWDLLKFGFNYLAGEAIGKIVLPSQNINPFLSLTQPQYFHTLPFEQHTVVTYDKVKLDTLEITHPSQKHTPAPQKNYVIHFVGNGMSYESAIGEMEADAEELQCSVVGFNLRGVGKSTGRARSKDDLVTDGIATVQRLLDQGVRPENITLKGHSLGAALATLVTHHFHQHYQAINVFNGRSFSSLTNTLVGWIRVSDRARSEETLTRKMLGWLAKPFIRLALMLSKWEINADDAFKNIPEKNKEYVVVRTPHSKRNSSKIDDPIVTHYASLHMALKGERRAMKSHLNSQSVELRVLKAKFNARKMENFNGLVPNGHIANLRHLKNRHGKSASAFFKEFVLKARVFPSTEDPQDVKRIVPLK